MKPEFTVLPMLDAHDGQVKPTHVAILTRRLKRGPAYHLVAVPIREDMRRFFGRGATPTLCLCELAGPSRGLGDFDDEACAVIGRRDCWTLTGDQMETLYREGVVDDGDRHVRIFRDKDPA